MKKRLVLLTTLAAMLAAAMALSGAAQANPIGGAADAKCAKLAIQTLGASYNPSNYTFIGGTEGADNFSGKATEGGDVFCGFGSNDLVYSLDEGDIFLGGTGNDVVVFNYGTFYGGEGNDLVYSENYGTFYGDAGTDQVELNYGTFYGGAGDDFVYDNRPGGTFYGDAGDDEVSRNYGTFYGGEGIDRVYLNYGTFYGGEGDDFVDFDVGGTFIQD